MELKEIEHLAELSKLKFTKDELLAFEKEFDSMIEMVDAIKNADVKGEYKSNIIKLSDLRQDTPKESASTELLLQNAPNAQKSCFVVPRVVE